jgi:hypothetical protein
MNKGIILFRTNDLNGAIAEVLLQTVSNTQKLSEVVVCEPSEMSGKLETYIDTGMMNKYSKVYIIGCGFDRRVAEKIDAMLEYEDISFVYRDHHRESLELSKYQWSRVLLLDFNENPISSSKNLYREIVQTNNTRYVRLTLLVDAANAVITGYTPVEDEHNKSLLEDIYNKFDSSVEFAKEMTQRMLNEEPFFNEAEILERLEAERKAKEEEEEVIRRAREEFKRRDRGAWW